MKVISNNPETTKYTVDTIWLCYNTNLWEASGVIKNKQFIRAKMGNKSSLTLNVTIVYGNKDYRQREELWKDLIFLSNQINRPWLLIGNFNAIRSTTERVGTHASYKQNTIDLFNNCLAAIGIKEIDNRGGSTTWCNGRLGEHRIGSKLDHGFGNMDFYNLWPEIKLDYYTSGTSDHFSLRLELMVLQARKTPFRFTNSWLRRDGIKEVVEEAWNIRVHGNSMYRFTKKLSNTKRVLKLWVKSWVRNDMELKSREKKLVRLNTNI